MARTEPSDPRLERATRWFARLDNEGSTTDDRQATDDWRRANPEHEQAWQETERLWASLGDLRGDLRLEEMRARAVSNSLRARERRWLPMALAASVLAVIGISTGLWWTSRQSGDEARSAAAAEGAAQAFASAPGQRKTLHLADGSTVKLNSDSEVTMRLTPGRREISLLKGQAFFSVEKDPYRPFTVEAGPVRAIVVGTAFDVRRGSDSAEVTTTEGLVRVEAAAGSGNGSPAAIRPTLVPAGVQFSMRGGKVSLAKVNARLATSWTEGLIVFDARCLKNVADAMNLYSPRKLRVGATAANLTISGTFRTGNIAAFVGALQQQGLVEVSDRGNDIYLSLAPGAEPSDVTCRQGPL